jgi:hypothetical protein
MKNKYIPGLPGPGFFIAKARNSYGKSPINTYLA